jgi:hypothetical protein
MSEYISGMLTTNEPILERMALAFSKIRGVREAHKEKLRENLDAVANELEPIVQEITGQPDLFLDGKGTGTAAAPTLEVRLPSRKLSPPTNRGASVERVVSRKPVRKRLADDL